MSAAALPVQVSVRRRFAASAERVFDAWLDPSAARRFLFTTPMGEIVRCEIDAQVGGSFCIVERRGETEAEHFGTYLEIERPRRLVFLFSVEKYATTGDRVTIEIEPVTNADGDGAGEADAGGGCELTLTHEMRPEWAEYRGKTESGWSGILSTLNQQLAERAPSVGV